MSDQHSYSTWHMIQQWLFQAEIVFVSMMKLSLKRDRRVQNLLILTCRGYYVNVWQQYFKRDIQSFQNSFVNFNSTEIGFKCLLVETSEDFGMSLADKETVIPMIHQHTLCQKSRNCKCAWWIYWYLMWENTYPLEDEA